jgi:PAS domain S-box-containing protein
MLDTQVFILRTFGIEQSDGRPVNGTTDHELWIDRVGINNEGFLGYQPAELIGRSILGLVEVADVPDMLGVFEEAFITHRSVSTGVAIRSKNGQVVHCEAIVVPLVPGHISAFALVLEEADMMAASPTDLATDRTEGSIPGLTLLTKREVEIVRRIVLGDRVHAIADRLFLSQSTVRNHLSSIYRKLGIVSQQQLVDRFRSTDDSSNEHASARR